MKISDFLSPTEALVSARASSKQQLLEQMAKKAAAKLKLPEDNILFELLKREGLGSTGMGNGVAIPHARLRRRPRSSGRSSRSAGFSCL